jgi:hypothetical protein
MLLIKRLLVLTFCMSSAAFADKVFVESARGNGVADSDRESIEELVRMAVPQSGSHTVVSKKEDADYTLAPSLMKLGDAYILTIQKKNKSGSTIFAEKMKAGNLSEMDNVSGRLTRAVINQTVVANTADVTNITTEEEHMNSRRYNATRQWVVGLGPGWSSNLNSKGGGFSFLLGFLWGLDPDFSISLTWLINNGPDKDHSTVSDFSLGGEYYFSRSKFSPFVGARLGYGGATMNTNNCPIAYAGCGTDRASGWAGGLTAGYKLFRTSTVNAAVIANYTQIFDRTSAGSPGLTALLLAVYF